MREVELAPGPGEIPVPDVPEPGDDRAALQRPASGFAADGAHPRGDLGGREPRKLKDFRVITHVPAHPFAGLGAQFPRCCTSDPGEVAFELIHPADPGEMRDPGGEVEIAQPTRAGSLRDRKSTRLNSSHVAISYA